MTKKNINTPIGCADLSKRSLFNSIELNEKEMENNAICQLHANRVGLILKVCLNRNLDVIQNTFLSKLEQLVKDTCNAIDNELCKTNED